MERSTTQKPANQHSRILVRMDDVLRRLMDITISLLGIILLMPIFIMVSIAIKRSSPGPVFYWGPRAGKNGKEFKILKFRTMYERKESYDGPKVTPEDDPRVTPLGRLLRQTKINELPQLWNVLIGDMSLVGPRPEDMSIAQSWPEGFRNEILSVRPGITSPASVVYRNEEDLLQSSNLMDTYLWDILPSKLRLDQIYVRNRSVLTDLDVIFWTAIALIPRLRQFSVPEHLLYWGPLSQFTSRYLWWFFVDFVIAFGAVAFAGLLRRLSTPFDLGIHVAALIAFTIALLFSLINTLVGLSGTNWAKARTQEALDLAFSTAIVTALVFVANLVFPSGTRFPISVILASGLLSYLGFVTVRYRTRLLTGMAKRWLNLRGQSVSTLGEPVLIVGAGEVARFAIWLLSNENLAQAFTIVGLVDDNPRKVGLKMDGYSVISTTSAIPDMVKKHDVGLILFAIADIQPTEQERILALCQQTTARIIPVPDVLDNLRAQFPKNETEREIHFNKVLHNATTDRLTGAYNRPQFNKLADVEYTRSLRYGRPLSLIVMNIEYNRPKKASYLRAIEAQVLQFAARRTMENIRGIDLLGRFGDNLLVVLLPETDEEAAAMVTQRLKERIADQTVSTNLGEIQTKADIYVITAKHGNFQTYDDLLEEALKPLTEAEDTNKGITISKSQLKEARRP